MLALCWNPELLLLEQGPAGLLGRAVGEALQGFGQGSSNLLLIQKATPGLWDRGSGNGLGCGFV